MLMVHIFATIFVWLISMKEQLNFFIIKVIALGLSVSQYIIASY